MLGALLRDNDVYCWTCDDTQVVTIIFEARLPCCCLAGSTVIVWRSVNALRADVAYISHSALEACRCMS